MTTNLRRLMARLTTLAQNLDQHVATGKNLTLEMDLTNTLAAAVQLVPSPILVDYIRISTGSGAILQTLYGEELWGYLAMTSNNVKMTGYQYITNTAPTTSVGWQNSSRGHGYLQYPSVAILPGAARLLPWQPQ